jgi:5-methylcytosine-specific restriction protein A
MPRKPRVPCPQPGCPELTSGGACDDHRKQREEQRGSNARKGGYDVRWQRIRKAFLYRNPWCVLCGRLANVADHWPLSRRELIARGEPKPDAPKHLRPLCVPCHNKETAKNQPGGFAAEHRSNATRRLV